GQPERSVDGRQRLRLGGEIVLLHPPLDLVQGDSDAIGESPPERRGLLQRPTNERFPEVEEDGTNHRRRFLSRSTCFQVRVFSTSSFVSQARRACPIPSST